MPFEFKKFAIPDIVLVKPKIFPDERGLFLEIYKESDFRNFGLIRNIVQVNQSVSRKNVLRGLHFQANPHAQAKFVGVNQGKIFDVVVDLREGSPGYGQWLGVNLDDVERSLLYVPEGFAHGFCVLSETAVVTYYCNQVYSPDHEEGIVWNDSALSIAWPVSNPIVSPKDAGLPSLKQCRADFKYSH